MAEPEDKSLDDQIKEAELEKHKAEAAKLRAEEKLIQKQAIEEWYSGRSLKLIAGGIVTALTVGSLVYAIFLRPIINVKEEVSKEELKLANITKQLVQAQTDSLNLKKEKIQTTIDSLFLLSNAFRFDTQEVFENALKQYRMIKAKDYFDSRLNPEGKGEENDFQIQVVEGDTVIYDAATKLTWQGGSEFPMWVWIVAQDYVDSLTYAGFDDWRLPTLEEAMSLIEPDQNEEGYYVKKTFNQTPAFWTANEYSASRAWYVNFSNGYCYFDGILYYSYVRAVR